MKFTVGEGACTLKVRANITNTRTVQRSDWLFGPSTKNYFSLANVDVSLDYLDPEIEKIQLPKDPELPFSAYTNSEKAKASCQQFADIWRSRKVVENLT